MLSLLTNKSSIHGALKVMLFRRHLRTNTEWVTCGRVEFRVQREQWRTSWQSLRARGAGCRRAVYRPLSAGACAAVRPAVVDPGRTKVGGAAWYDFHGSSTRVLPCNYNTWAWHYEVYSRLPAIDRRSFMSDERILYDMPVGPTSLNSKYISVWCRPPYKSVGTSSSMLSAMLVLFVLGSAQ